MSPNPPPLASAVQQMMDNTLNERLESHHRGGIVSPSSTDRAESHVSNWALVVGIDLYDVPKYHLGGAVSDALQFLHWCVNGGGNVPPGNVNLLLEQQPGKDYPKKIPEGVVPQIPSRDNFIVSVDDFLTRSNSSGERCFFYFAGHGISARVNGADVPCICLKNFAPVLTNNAVSLPSLFARFKATRFLEQYFFIDACRNIPFHTEFEVSNFDRGVVPVGDPYPQFAAYATQPRNTAAELILPGYEGGAFTRALLAGLLGEGASKQWDGENSQYVVRWNSLFKFVERSVSALKLPSPVSGKVGVIQVPKQYGDRGSEDPVLASFQENKFGRQQLRVEFTPPEAGPHVSLIIGQFGADNMPFPAPLAPLPWHIELPPRIYSVVAKATQFVSKRPMSMVELYDTYPLTIEMIAAPPEVSPPNPELAGTDDDEGLESAWLLPHRDDLPAGICTSDGLVQMEIADPSGRILAAGRGKLDLPVGAGRGLFRVRTVGPDGTLSEALVELSAKGQAPSALIDTESPPMTPAVSWVTAQCGMTRTSSGLLVPSEAIGPAAYVKLSTLLALAAGASVEAGGPGGKLRNLPLPPTELPQALGDRGAIRILMGDELLKMDWTASRLSIAPIDAPERLSVLTVKSSPATESIVGAEAVLAPGSYWLSLEAPNDVASKMTLCVLPNRITLVVLTREVDLNLDLHQYSLWLPSTNNPEPSYLDPEYRTARFPVIRRIELMQRSYVGDRTFLSMPDIDALLYQKWIDPIAGCLGGYMLVRSGRARELEIPSFNLTSHFGDLPDSWLLRACCFEAQNLKSDTQSAVRQALAAGVPIFSQGIRRLAELSQQHAHDHPRAALMDELAKSCIEGGIFSVFRPNQVGDAMSGAHSAHHTL